MSDENPAQSGSQNPPGDYGQDKKPVDKPPAPKSDDCQPVTSCPKPPKRPPDPVTPTAAPPTGTPPAKPKTAREQLEALKKSLEDKQAELQKLEPVKTSVADLEQRIQALEKTVDGEPASETTHKEFYRATRVQASEYDLVIKSVRCELKLTKDQEQCVKDAIKAVNDRISKARKKSDDANDDQRKKEAAYKEAEKELAWQRKYYEFLKSGVQLQVTKLRDDLKALKALADPTKDQCVAAFYLLEMDEALKEKAVEDACWKPDLSIGDFLKCWPWADCYKDAWNTAVVAFNEADAAEKLAKSEVEQAKKTAADLDKLAKEAETKRRDWILKELKECCAPKATAS
jgi:hypothetical protein